MTDILQLSHHSYFISEESPITVERRHYQPPFPLHRHDFNEIVIISAGNGIHFWNDEIHPITTGNVLYIESGDKHKYGEVDKLKLDNILYRPEKLSLFPIMKNYIPHNNEKKSLRINQETLAQLQSLISQLEIESKKTNKSSMHLSEAIFLQILILICRTQQQENKAYSDISKLESLFSALNQSISQEFYLADFCRQHQLAVSSVRRIFKQQTNMTIAQYLQKLRLCRAATLLRNTSESVANIAIRCGYSDSNYFSSVFGKTFSCTPTEYRSRFIKK